MFIGYINGIPVVCEQLTFQDRFNSLPPLVQKQIEDKYSVYANDLSKILARNLDKIKAVFKDKAFQPSDSTAFTMGMLFILQCRDNSSIDELLMRANTDIAYQYVLSCTSNSGKPVISRAYYCQFLQNMGRYDEEHSKSLMETIFNEFTDVAASEMGINLHQNLSDEVMTRIDSMMIDTPAEHLTRAGIIYRTVAMCLDLKASLEGLGEIPASLHHYLDEKDENVMIYHNKEDKMPKLEGMLKDALEVKTLLAGYEAFQEYSLLVRMIDDQGKIEPNGRIVPKEDKEILGSSMQSPLYPFATCRKKYGFQIGDACCFTEATYHGSSLLIEVLHDKNIVSDDEFMMEHIRRKDPNGPIEVCCCDAGFFSTKTLMAASAAGIILIPSALKGSLPKELYADFELDAEGTTIVTCPGGNTPIPGTQKYDPQTGVITAKIKKCQCEQCPHREYCPHKEQGKASKVEVSKKKIDLAEQVSAVESDEYKEFANYRNGIESVPSVMRRVYGFDTLRSMNVSLRKEKIFASCINYNCKKLIAFRKNRDNAKNQAA